MIKLVKLSTLALMCFSCEPEFSRENRCAHTIENYDDFSGYCWCDPASCEPSTYNPRTKK